ncbi:MAG: DNA-binding response regulator [Firmicutes bacterium HGW-Firmicutes-1]|jgi:DNA-binding NarL/FixJ family response regulator|nr:MAG: DNA-binding response regulator [Firmicutes bacterium HGW-Firmicutes-1]
MIKVLIADDQTLFRTMLETVLASDNEIEVIGTAANGMDAVQLALKYKPDIVLLDIQMPQKNGIEALGDIKEKLPKSKIIMLTTFENVESIIASANAGADGYLLKNMKPDILIMAIKCVYNGIVMIHKESYDIIFASKSGAHTKNEGRIEFGDISFDRTDIRIMAQVADGRTNKEIAQILNYSEGTIKNRISNILSITGLSDRTQISVFALKNNII